MRERRIGRIRGGVLTAALVVTGAAHAFAPPGQYDFYGPATSEITDFRTELTWQRYLDPEAKTFPDAVASCVTRGQNWRLPTVKELQTLVDEQPMHEWVSGKLTYPPIDSNAFPQTPPANFWTASARKDGVMILVVDFENGMTAEMSRTKLDNKARVRCVKNQ